MLERLAHKGALAGALVTVDAFGCNPRVTASIIDHRADYLIALKGNQGDLLDDVKTFFDDPGEPLDTHVDHDKGHGRIEERTARVSGNVAWLARDKFPDISLIACIDSKVTKGTQITREQRFYIASGP